jgi:cellulose synthase/poly-beta-1,6-N-acetylglucosamine synthase-like glycosyltransferase/peptidoglycan/xylan/chitin deacetylase (PgdA/CDA1 family)/spore germination protein YaaH
MAGPENIAPVFSEPTGQRWQRVRLGAIIAGVVSILVVAGLIAAALLPPVLPQSGAFDPAGASRPAPLSRRAAAQHDAARERLYRALRRGERLQGPTAGSAPRRDAEPPAADSLVAAFYVDWAEQSYESLREHLDRLDWVIAEWAFISSSGDTLRLSHDHKILKLIDQVPAARRPKVLLMVSNVVAGSAGRFGGINSQRLLANPAIRRRAAQRLAREVHDFGLAGVTVDFEDIPDSSLPELSAFLDDLRAALGTGPLLTQTIQDYLPPEWARRFASKCDRVILMLYDEHYDKDDPGPIAGRGWFTEKLDSLMAVIPPSKAMVGIGAYGGYDWNDAGNRADLEQVTVPDIWHLSRQMHVLPSFDTDVYQPYLSWTGADSVDHFIWYEDATTAADEMRIARQYGVRSVALWRLGSEDPSVWRLFVRRGQLPPLGTLDTIAPAYNVNFDGFGDLLTVRERPYPGARRVSTRNGELANVVTDSVPGEWVVARSGHHPGEIALTFDDGPDPRWTPAILDTLRSRHVTATFFMIGDEVASHYSLTRRVLHDGNEIGNHTFTHPNLAVTSAWWTRLQLDATNRLFEAIVGRRTILLRTPYLGDNDPSTPDELVPIAIASKLGYITVGVSVDGEDWQPRVTANEIVLNVLEGRDQAEARDAGDVVLLHDGGGDRSRTVAVLGRLIDSLRVRGDTIVSLGQLAGLSPDAVMPPVTGRSSYTRLLELAMFGGISILELGFYWAFFAAILLGMARLLVVLVLAGVQRFRHRRFVGEHTPTVSVVIPAFREEAVIVPTIKSLLAQDYGGEIEIVVVDDGSPDDTYGVAQRAFADQSNVRVLTKPNGGKASALNFGIDHAHGDILVALDADTLFDPAAVRHLVAPLADPHVGAVAGNAKVGNRINLVTRWQALEYVTSQNLDRRAFALLDCIMVVPGAIGAWRKSLVIEVGGFSHDTLAEDQDLTLSIGRRGYRVAYADDAIAWTEAPDTLGALAKQRFRWSFGTLQCAWKHRDLLFRRDAGTLGSIALPNVWLYQLFFSFIAPAADLVFVFSLIGVFMMYHEHDTTYAIGSLNKIVGWYAIFIVFDWCAATLAFLMEPHENRRLTWLVFLQRFVYRQIMYWVVLRSVVAALRGGLVGWGKLDRKATVGLQST